jgi:hypothetical protein
MGLHATGGAHAAQPKIWRGTSHDRGTFPPVTSPLILASATMSRASLNTRLGMSGVYRGGTAGIGPRLTHTVRGAGLASSGAGCILRVIRPSLSSCPRSAKNRLHPDSTLTPSSGPSPKARMRSRRVSRDSVMVRIGRPWRGMSKR